MDLWKCIYKAVAKQKHMLVENKDFGKQLTQKMANGLY